MEGRFLDNLTNAFELDLPSNLETLEQFIEYIVPKVQPWSEDLREEKFYVGKRWKEIRDTDTYHETVLHMFMPGGLYMVVIDGDISKGVWQYMAENNTFILDYGGKSQLFDLTFLNDDFFILQKHGDQIRKGKQKYFVYGAEGMLNKKKLDWRAAMEELYNIYRNNSKFSTWVMLILLVLVAFVVLQFT
jgi:hypothetical protein